MRRLVYDPSASAGVRAAKSRRDALEISSSSTSFAVILALGVVLLVGGGGVRRGEVINSSARSVSLRRLRPHGFSSLICHSRADLPPSLFFPFFF